MHPTDEVVESLSRLLEKLTTSMDTPIQLPGLPSLHMKAGIGYCLYPDHGQSLHELLSKADLAMYAAKKRKTNRALNFEPEMMHALERRLQLEKGLTVIAAGGKAPDMNIYYVFQPFFDSNSLNIKGVEVLTRCHHEKLGTVHPIELIALAEDIGLIQGLTERMLEVVLPKFMNWRVQSGFRGTLAINVSSSLINSDSFIQYLIQTLEQFPDLKGKIELEITENLELITSPTTSSSLGKLQKAGIMISIDDFGTGYSKLSYFSEIQIDRVKIDKYYIRQIGNNNRGEAVLVSLLQLAMQLGIQVTAEGVETQAQLAFLQKQGCQDIQGFLLARPLMEGTLKRNYMG